jgi:hypothetical protein
VRKVATKKPVAKKTVAKKKVATKTIAKKTVVKKTVSRKTSAHAPAAAAKPARKKTVTKKVVATPTPAGLTGKTALSQKAYRERADKLRASVEKAKATKAANLKLLGTERPKVDPGDEAAIRRIDAKFVGWKRAAEQATAASAEDIDNDASNDDASRSPRRKRSAVDRLDDPSPATGLVLIKRVTGAIERELTQIELIVGGNRTKAAQRTEAERRARTLASLARTLTELKKLRGGEEQGTADDYNRPRDLDELRRRIFERLGKAVGARTAQRAVADVSRRDGSDQ